MLPQPDNNPLSGIAWMLVTGLSFVAVNATVRHLGTDLPAAESAFIRFAFGLLFLGPSLVLGFRAGLPRAAIPLVLGRGALHTMAVMLWFFAMARIPLAEVTAIGYLNPIVVTAGAALFLGEQIALRRMTAIGVALVGAVIVLRPGMREILPGHFAQLGAALFFGLSYLIAKRLSGMVRPVTLVAFLSLTVTVGLAPFAAAVWVPPTAEQTFWLAIVAAFATFGHYAMMRAFAAAPLTVTQPVTFLQLVWATLLGALVFGEPVDPYVLAGGGMIIAAISYMTLREAQLRRRVTTPAPEAAKI
ncbi:DMT family transporter [Defluviimonas sp. WL0002]|uniref:DMT family transporter n=1 Tax=Albidovulum marisflavi TaxID=2984159 RepID=A0ABT2ZAK1_9RHOB|nr:DMT family transporter [Defluviimonas sp. WL0002]MCV2868113.1 DMT family transporter [Defluviimonas sp. WL0002]